MDNDDCKDDESMEILNRLIKLDNNYEMIIENLNLRYDLGIITTEGSIPSYKDKDMIDKKELFYRKAVFLTMRNFLENMELIEMVNELKDENIHLKQEVKQVKIKEIGMMINVNALKRIDKLQLIQEIRDMLKYDGFNLNVMFHIFSMKILP